MSYQEIDNILSEWAVTKKIDVATDYKDEEVRFMKIFSSKGKWWQLSVDVPRENKVGLHVWHDKRTRKDVECNVEELTGTLDLLFNFIESR